MEKETHTQKPITNLEKQIFIINKITINKKFLFKTFSKNE